MSIVREAMVREPGQLPADASAQAAGELLQRPEVRAIFVTDEERLVGVVTRKTLVREVVARGRDPRTTRLGHIAEEPYHVIGPDVPLEEAFRFLEERDAERVPVVDARGRLLGVLSRSVLQRRLAEEAEPADDAEDAPDDLPPAA
ncbi:MAG: CBS domain-containing protein [Thermoleophilia bacterium]|nr:CBS domain-containing protein [Thermoleophilia bacterium]